MTDTLVHSHQSQLIFTNCVMLRLVKRLFESHRFQRHRGNNELISLFNFQGGSVILPYHSCSHKYFSPSRWRPNVDFDGSKHIYKSSGEDEPAYLLSPEFTSTWEYSYAMSSTSTDAQSLTELQDEYVTLSWYRTNLAQDFGLQPRLYLYSLFCD